MSNLDSHKLGIFYMEDDNFHILEEYRYLFENENRFKFMTFKNTASLCFNSPEYYEWFINSFQIPFGLNVLLQEKVIQKLYVLIDRCKDKNVYTHRDLIYDRHGFGGKGVYAISLEDFLDNPKTVKRLKDYIDYIDLENLPKSPELQQVSDGYTERTIIFEYSGYVLNNRTIGDIYGLNKLHTEFISEKNIKYIITRWLNIERG